MREVERDWLRACALYLRLHEADGLVLSGRSCTALADAFERLGTPPAVALGGNVVPFVRPAAAPAPLAQEKQS